MQQTNTHKDPQARSLRQHARLLYPNAPWTTARITMMRRDPVTERPVLDANGRPISDVLCQVDPVWDLHDADLLPKEQWLLDYIDSSLERDAGVIVMIAYVNRGLQERLEWLIRQQLHYEGVTYCNVSARRRTGWYRRCVRDDIRVIISHPAKLRRGMNLIAHPHIVFYQPINDSRVVKQAMGRAWRLGQKHDCEVRFPYYADTAEHAMLTPLAEKIIADNQLRGAGLAGGLLDMGYRPAWVEATQKAITSRNLPHLGTLWKQGAIGDWAPPDVVAATDRSRRDARRRELAAMLDPLDLAEVVQGKLL